MLSSLVDLSLVDLVVVVLVGLAAAGALRHRRGLLGALGAGGATLLLAWLVVAGLSTWGPTSLAHAADHSRLLQSAPVPERALHQAHDLTH